MKIGGQGGSRPFLIPDNLGMANRVNQRIESVVASHNLRAQEALKADGVPIIVWHRNDGGGRLCTCTSAAGNKMPAAFRGPDPTGPLRGLVNVPEVEESPDDGVDLLGLGGQSMTSSGLEVELGEWGEEEIEAPDVPTLGKDGEMPSPADDEDVVDAYLSGDTSFGTPAVYGSGYTTAESVSCPVCAGASYVDSWQPSGGRRVVMAFQESDSFDTNGVIDVESHPNVLALDDGRYLDFAMKLPKYFGSVMRFSAWNGRRELANLPLLIMDQGGYSTASAKALSAMGAGQGGVKHFRIEAKDRLLLTHVEAVVLLSDMAYAQFPPLNAPLDIENQDYMTSITIEVGANIRIAPGDLVSDFKMRKMWRVTNVVRKSTAGGRTSVSQVDLQSVPSTDKAFVLHPFYVSVEQGPKMFSGTNEAFQGGTGQPLAERSV